VVELCVHAGAPVPDQYRSMMRLDVVSPERDEVDLVAWNTFFPFEGGTYTFNGHFGFLWIKSSTFEFDQIWTLASCPILGCNSSFTHSEYIYQLILSSERTHRSKNYYMPLIFVFHIYLHSAQTAQFLAKTMLIPELLPRTTAQHLGWTSMHNGKGSSTMLRVQKYVKHTIGRVFSQNIAY
jgi:hypothetical protein